MVRDYAFLESNDLRHEDRPGVLSRIFKMNGTTDKGLEDKECIRGKAIVGKVFIIFNFNSIN